jgi:hypothetical protein
MKELEKNDENYVISGMIDVTDPETKTPIEIKYQHRFRKARINTTFSK